MNPNVMSRQERTVLNRFASQELERRQNAGIKSSGLLSMLVPKESDLVSRVEKGSFSILCGSNHLLYGFHKHRTICVEYARRIDYHS